MFRFIFILILSLSLATACSDSIQNPELRRAETLLEAAPDSALKILQGMDPDHLNNDDERWLRRLFILSARDLTYAPPAKDDKEIKEIIHYFIDGNHLKRVHPLVYYYAGRSYTELDQDAKALGYYSQALRIMKRDRHSTKDYSLLMSIHAQKGGLFQKHHLYTLSLNEFRKYLSLAYTVQDTIGIISATLNCAHIQRSRHFSDSALNMYRQIFPLVKGLNDSIILTTYLSQLAINYYDKGNLQSADSILNLLPSHTDNASEHSVLTIQNILNYHLRNIPFDEQVFIPLTKDSIPENRFEANKYLALNAIQNRDGEALFKYSLEAFENLNQMQTEFNSNALAEIENLITNAELENENLQLSAINEEKNTLLIICISLIFLLIVVILASILRVRVKRIRYNLQIETMKASNRKMVIELEKKALDAPTKENDKTYRIEENLKNNLLLDEIIEKFSTGLMASPIQIKESDFSLLKETIFLTCPSLVTSLNEMNLTPREYKDALLIKINIPQKLCAEYFHVTPSAIANARARLFKKWCKDTQYKNWKEFILSL